VSADDLLHDFEQLVSLRRRKMPEEFTVVPIRDPREHRDEF
jgi:hypothetical protein